MSAIRVERLTVAYRGRPAVSDIDLVVERGERLALVGPNGAGKSTLLRAIAGLAEPDAGTIVLGGSPLSDLDRLSVQHHSDDPLAPRFRQVVRIAEIR